MAQSDRIILGIDPGTIVMGYGIIQIQDKVIKTLAIGVIKLDKFDDHAIRLQKIFERTIEIIEEYNPDELAIEAPFFGKNVQSMLKLGRAQGVAIAAAMQAGLKVTEYSPKKVKQSITGNGNADKEQVWKMLQTVLSVEEKPQYFDATDALAVALCHFYQSNSKVGKQEKGVKGWAEFIKNNPGKVKVK